MRSQLEKAQDLVKQIEEVSHQHQTERETIEKEFQVNYL